MSRADEIMGLNDLSEEEQDYYGSSDEEQGRSKQFSQASRPSKDDSDDEEASGEDENEAEDTQQKEEAKKILKEKENRKVLKQIKKSGVVYLSTIPPYMKPVKVRQVLERFGKVGRIYLAPEDPKEYTRRVKSGGNRKKKFVEGWVEFLDKNKAKLAVESLNGNPLGGKKGSFYYDDIMNLRYLPKFKWHDLTEQIALEAQERQEKLKAEIAQATRENRVFIDNVEKKQYIERRKRKAEEEGASDAGKPNDNEPRFERTFSQKPAKINKSTDADKKDSKALSNVLSKLF